MKALILGLTALIVPVSPTQAEDKSGTIFNCDMHSIGGALENNPDKGTSLVIFAQGFPTEAHPTSIRVIDAGSRLQGSQVETMDLGLADDGALRYSFKPLDISTNPLLLVIQGSKPQKIAPNGTAEMTATVGFMDERGPQSVGICNVFQHTEAADWFAREAQSIEKKS